LDKEWQREGEKEKVEKRMSKEGGRGGERVWERERNKECERERERVCVCVCVRERER
jgi:hypothetical protein